MKFCLSLAAFGLLLSGASAASIENELFPRDGKGYIELAVNSPGPHYSAFHEFSVGNPPQKIRAGFDTGSSEVWFKGSDSLKDGYYDPKASKTSKYINSDFSIGYLKGGAKGDNYQDVLNFEGISSIPLQFGVANKTSTEAVFGISPGKEPASFPLALKQQGVIKSVSYSFIGENDPSRFTLIFGGIDHNRYEGELKFLPWSKSRTFALDLDYITVNGTKVPSNIPVVFDTGTTFLHVKAEIYQEIVKLLGGKVVGDYEVLIGDGKPCEELDLKPFEFSFANGQSVIRVPTESVIYFEESRKSCVVHITNSSANLFPLTAMDSVYLAWNNDDKTIAVANNKNATTKNIQPIL